MDSDVGAEVCTRFVGIMSEQTDYGIYHYLSISKYLYYLISIYRNSPNVVKCDDHRYHTTI